MEILKTLYRHSNLLVLDEPSAVLTPQEIDDLFEVMRSLARAGTSIIFITHKLNEVLVIADRITVLRRGKVVGTTTPDATDEAELARMMVGRPVQLEVTKGPAEAGAEVLTLRGVTVRDDRHQVAVNDLDLTVHAGEIVAIAGVQGNGQTELVEAITGLRHIEHGTIQIAGAPAKADPRHVFAAGRRARPRGPPRGGADRRLHRRREHDPEQLLPGAVLERALAAPRHDAGARRPS